MSDAADIAHQRRLEIAGRLAELALSLVEDAHGRALAADTPEARRAAIDEFERLSRAGRLGLALHEKLSRTGEADARERQESAARQTRARRTAERRLDVRERIGAVIWNEYDRPDAESLSEELEDLLAAEAASEAFLLEDPDALILRLCLQLGVEPPTPLPPRRGEGEVRERAAGPLHPPDRPARTPAPSG